MEIGTRRSNAVPAKTDAYATESQVGWSNMGGQLETQLRKHQFLPERHLSALYQFPSGKRFWLKSGRMFERFGQFLPAIAAGGALMVEASKLVYPPKGTVQRYRPPVSVLEGVARPVADQT